MKRRQRGRTIRVRFVDDPTKRDKWGAFWNEYKPGVTGRPKQRAQFFATEAEALEFQRLTLAKLDTPDDPVSAIVDDFDADTVVGFARSTWLPHVEDERDAATFRSYTWLTNAYLAKYDIGRTVLHERFINPVVVKAFYGRLHADGVTLGTRRHVHAALSALCSFAKEAGKFPTVLNPCFRLGKSLRKKGETDTDEPPNPLAVDVVAKFFDQLEAVDPHWLPFFQFLHDVGVRPGEAAALPWDHVNLDDTPRRISGVLVDPRQALIAFNYSPAGGADKDTKTHQTRTVDLTSRVVDQLIAWKPIQGRDFMRRGRRKPFYVFTTERDGKQARQDGTARDVFDRTMTAIDVDGHTPYNLRDTFAVSHLVEDWNRKLAWVARQLGHAKPSTTEEHYYAFKPTTATRGFADEIRSRR